MFFLDFIKNWFAGKPLKPGILGPGPGKEEETDPRQNYRRVDFQPTFLPMMLPKAI